MRMTEEQWNIRVREEIQKARKHLADALEAISKPECDFDAAMSSLASGMLCMRRCANRISEGRWLHGDE